MWLLICFLLNTPYHEEQAGQPFAEIKLFQKHWQFNVVPQLNPTSLWAVTPVCHFGYILPTQAGSETPHLPDEKSFPDFQAFAARSTV